jgi:hypothetical protein
MVSNTLKQLFRSTLSIALFTAAWTGAGLAQDAGLASHETPAEKVDSNTMDTYLINHPNVREELKNDPSLINNKQWLAQHPEVNHWMANHPQLRSAALANPNSVVNRTENMAGHDAMHEVKTTDAFLAKHPETAKELEKDPNLINNKQYLAQHPALQNYLNTHPNTASEWQNHPGAFTRDAENYEKAQREKSGPHSGTQPRPVAHNTAVAHSKR